MCFSEINMSNMFFIAWREYVEDYRPILFPPTKQILGWWLIGCGVDRKGEYHKVCAYVVAENKDQVNYIILKNWPEFDVEDIELCKEVNSIKNHPKFKIEEWMKDRIKEWKNGV